jgi:hypothetical protein
MAMWIILFASLFILFAIVEEVIYYILRTRVIENDHPAKEGKIKSLYKKVKLKLSPS